MNNEVRPFPAEYSQVGTTHTVNFYNNGEGNWGATITSVPMSSEGRVILQPNGTYKVVLFSQSLIAHEMGHGFANVVGGDPNKQFPNQWTQLYRTIFEKACPNGNCNWLDAGQLLPWFDFGETATGPTAHTGRNWSTPPLPTDMLKEFAAEGYALWALGYLANPTMGSNQNRSNQIDDVFVSQLLKDIECEIKVLFNVIGGTCFVKPYGQP